MCRQMGNPVHRDVKEADEKPQKKSRKQYIVPTKVEEAIAMPVIQETFSCQCKKKVKVIPQEEGLAPPAAEPVPPLATPAVEPKKRSGPKPKYFRDCTGPLEVEQSAHNGMPAG